ncbi:hypothetical protein [uncultured Arcobacter sp.]|uniref:hypothetical protein n=1 Tax=uncultured Arcobacter sp. TaxID=165434 RepID=UPI002626D91A|nr:hypothetical protein [uncultured Arcobacter sp.]
MSTVTSKKYGKKQEFLQRPENYISAAIDEFLLAEYPDKLLSSLIHLSIGLETFLKQQLEKIDSRLIYSELNNSIYTKLKQYIKIVDKKSLIKSSLNSSKPKKYSQTISFEKTIILISSFYKIPKQIIYDLNTLKDIRNGVFHWRTQLHDFIFYKLFMRIFYWFYKFIIKFYNNDPILATTQIDPFHRKKNIIDDLKKYIKNEVAFNVRKKIYKANLEYGKYTYIKARVDGQVILKPERFVYLPCPSCDSKRIAIYNTSINCEICSFALTNIEYNKYINFQKVPITFDILHNDEKLKILGIKYIKAEPNNAFD